MDSSPAYPFIKNPHLDGDPFIFEGGRTGILLVHGYKATPAEMRPLAKFLHYKGYTVAGPLLPGHNTDPRDANKFTWKNWVDSIEKSYFEMTRRCEQVFIGGESAGGLISLYLASYHPEITGVLTYAPALDIHLRKQDIYRLYLAAHFIPWAKEVTINDTGADLAWRGYSVTPLKGLIQLLKLQRKTLPRLRLIRRPILIVQGRLDNRVPPSVPHTIYEAVQSTLKEIHWMDNSSHCVVLDQELDRVKKVTLKFMEKALLI